MGNRKETARADRPMRRSSMCVKRFFGRRNRADGHKAQAAAAGGAAVPARRAMAPSLCVTERNTFAFVRAPGFAGRDSGTTANPTRTKTEEQPGAARGRIRRQAGREGPPSGRRGGRRRRLPRRTGSGWLAGSTTRTGPASFGKSSDDAGRSPTLTDIGRNRRCRCSTRYPCSSARAALCGSGSRKAPRHPRRKTSGLRAGGNHSAAEKTARRRLPCAGGKKRSALLVDAQPGRSGGSRRHSQPEPTRTAAPPQPRGTRSRGTDDSRSARRVVVAAFGSGR